MKPAGFLSTAHYNSPFLLSLLGRKPDMFEYQRPAEYGVDMKGTGLIRYRQLIGFFLAYARSYQCLL